MHPLVDAFIKGRAKFKKEQSKYFGPKGNTACHLGALMWGAYGNEAIKAPFDTLLELKRDFPEVAGPMLQVPCEHSDGKEHPGWQEGGHITSILIHLNDSHDGRSGWSDKNVAGWLAEALK